MFILFIYFFLFIENKLNRRKTFNTKTVESNGHQEKPAIHKTTLRFKIKEPSFVIFIINFYVNAQITVLSQRGALNSPGKLAMAYACLEMTIISAPERETGSRILISRLRMNIASVVPSQ